MKAGPCRSVLTLLSPLGAIAATLLVLGVLAVVLWHYSIERRPASPERVDVGPALQAVPTTSVKIPNVTFKDVTEQAGISFRHWNGAFGKKLLPETMGSGVAFLDYNQDGHQDLLFINSCSWPGHAGSQQPVPTQALYRNRGDGTFEDVTTAAGLALTLYGMGVTVGDYDNDGWPDLFITAVGGNRLLHNEGGDRAGRRFVDVTHTAGVGGPGHWPVTSAKGFLELRTPLTFSSSAAFVDYNGDARLDLFVCNYVTWSPDFDLSQGFQLVGVGRAYGPPTAFEGTQCILYRNSGDGRFEDVSAQAGIHVRGPLERPVGKSLGVVACDLDDDNWPDIVVANDTVRNFLFHNKGDGTFEEVGEFSQVALADGHARGAMGLDWGEYRPGRSALLIGNFANEPNTFLRLDNARMLIFSDAALAEGIAGPSRPLLKFGAFFFDYDLDGRQDLLTCNGHLEPEIPKVQAGQHYRQPVQLFWNCAGKASFVPVTERDAGSDLFQPIVGRSCAYADMDGDGDLDVVLTENNGPARLLRNEDGSRHHWIRLVLEGDGVRSNRSAIGARVTLEAGDVVLHRQIVSARGYLSQSELAVTFGLGNISRIDRIRIQWPSKQGGEQEVTGLAVDRVHAIRQAGKE